MQQAQEPAGSPRVETGASSHDRSAADTRRPAGETSSIGLGGLTGAAGLPAPLPEHDPFPGMLVGGVRILRRIGEGGMGRVYEGQQQEPSRRVAVKLLRPVFVTDEARRRFKQEAEFLGQLTHPGQLDLEGCSVAEADHVVRSRVPPPVRRLHRDLPLHVERVVARCLEKNPADRFPDAAGLATALRDPGTGAVPRPLGRRLVVAGALGLPFAAAAALSLVRGTGPAELTVRFDLRSPPEGLLVRAAEARINRESFGASMYWAPERPGIRAEIVYRIQAPFPIADASFADVRVDAWNAHADVTFDPLAEAHLDVSPDGVRWTALASTSPATAPWRDDRAAVAAVRGSRAVFLRARLFESRSFARNSVHYAQFLRSEPQLGRVPSLTLYRVGQAAHRETGR